MRCGNCGAEIDNGMTSCPYCGATVRYMGQSNNSWQQGGWSGQNTDFNQGYQNQSYQNQWNNYNDASGFKSQAIALVLNFFLGTLGVHRFYLGKIGTGIIWLLTLGVFGIGYFVDFIRLLFNKMKDKKGRPLILCSIGLRVLFAILAVGMIIFYVFVASVLVRTSTLTITTWDGQGNVNETVIGGDRDVDTNIALEYEDDTPSDDAYTDNEQDTSSGYSEQDDVENEQATTVTSGVVYDNNGIRVELISYGVSEWGDLQLGLRLTNNTNEVLDFISTDTSINGYMFDELFMYKTVGAGETVDGGIHCNLDELTDHGITEVADIGFSIELSDSEYNTVDIIGPFSFETDNAATYDYNSRPHGDVLFDQQGITIEVLGYTPKADDTGINVLFYVENKYTDTVTFNQDYSYVNGIEYTDDLIYLKLNPGEKTIYSLSFYDEDMGAMGLTPRAPFELVLQLSCYDTSYSSVAELPEMTVSVG